MGSPPDQQPTTPAKPPNSKTPPAPASAAPPSTAQELPATPPYAAEWAAAAAFYGQAGAAGPPAIFQPWAGQHLVAPYGTPIAYPPMYHPAAAAMYAHPSMAAAAVAAYPAPESGNGSKSKKGYGRSGDGGGKVTSGSAEEDGSQSGGSSEGEGSSDTRDDSADPQDASRKRSFNDSFGEGETSQPITGAQNTAESAYSGRARTAAKLPVSAPGRAALPGPAPNLNIGMELWSTSHATTAPVNVRPNSVKIASSTAGANGVIPEQQFLQQDERELKRERRKQSNRESARRSRLRKQQECEDLAKKVSELTGENKSLRLELEQLTNVCKDLEADNASIMEELNRMHGAGLAPEFEGIKHNSLSKPSVGSEGSGAPQNPVGSNGKIHSSGGNF